VPAASSFPAGEEMANIPVKQNARHIPANRICLERQHRIRRRQCNHFRPKSTVKSFPLFDLAEKFRGAVSEPRAAFLIHSKKIVSRFGPCAPRTKMRSMSPVRLGPVMNDIMPG
jgi:hypothetical protein